MLIPTREIPKPGKTPAQPPIWDTDVLPLPDMSDFYNWQEAGVYPIDKYHYTQVITGDDSYIYCGLYDEARDKRLLYKMNPDGTGRTVLDEGVESSFSYADGYLYYFKDKDGIYYIKPDGTGKRELYDYYAPSFFPTGRNIYVDWVFDDVWAFDKVSLSGKITNLTGMTDNPSFFHNGIIYMQPEDNTDEPNKYALIRYDDAKGILLTGGLKNAPTGWPNDENNGSVYWVKQEWEEPDKSLNVFSLEKNTDKAIFAFSGEWVESLCIYRNWVLFTIDAGGTSTQQYLIMGYDTETGKLHKICESPAEYLTATPNMIYAIHYGKREWPDDENDLRDIVKAEVYRLVPDDGRLSLVKMESMEGLADRIAGGLEAQERDDNWKKQKE